MNEQSKDLKAKLSEWVRSEGFPFEMRVARAFQKVGFLVNQSDYYKDPTTKVHREIDVIARLNFLVKPLVIRIEFLIECKSSKDKPWVVFCGDEEELERPAWVANRFASDAGMKMLHYHATDKEFQSLSLFRLRAPVGYGLRQAFGKSEDVAYNTMASVSSAARAKADYFREHVSAPKLLEFQFPVIALDSRLFECRLNSNEETEMNEVPFATLLWNNPIATPAHTLIDVITEPSITAFAGECHEGAYRLMRLLTKTK